MRRTLAVLSIALIFPLLVGGAAVNDDPLAKGIRLFDQGSYQQAIEPLSKAVAARPADAVARLTFGVALANNRRYDDAIVQFRKVTLLSPNDPISYFLLDGAYQAKGQTILASGFRREAEQRLGEKYRVVAGTLGAAGPAGPAASASGTKAAGKLSPVVSDWTTFSLPEQAAAQHPESAIAQNLLGDYYQVRGNVADAIVHYRIATERAPGWVKPWFNLGMANLSVNPTEATANFKKVIELDPQNLQAQLWLGDAYSKQKDYPNALKSYNQAANAQGLRSAANSRSGNVYLKTNQLDKAEEQFRNAAKEAPRDPVPQAGLGDVSRQQGKLPESQQRYKVAQDLAQVVNNMPQSAIITKQQADVSIQQGDYHKAIAELKETVAVNPSSSETVRSLARAYQRGGILPDGIAEYRGSLDKNPHDKTAMRFLLFAYGMAGDQSKRAEMARKLLKEVPDNSAEWYRELGSALAGQKDRDGALDAWRHGLEVDPTADTTGILPSVESAGMMEDLTALFKTDSATKKAPSPSLILATIYERRHEYAAAVEVRRKLTRLYPGAQQYWIWLAEDLVQTGDKAGARDAYSRASQMNDSLTLRALAQQKLKGLQ